jgi:hypothetical protein
MTSFEQERKILETTYTDNAAIYRRINGEKDPVTKQTRQTEELIHTAVPGGWSKNSGDPYRSTGLTGLARVDGVYFCAPDADIQLGDKVTVTTAAGDCFTLRAGRPMRYVSHAEVPLGGDERA